MEVTIWEFPKLPMGTTFSSSRSKMLTQLYRCRERCIRLRVTNATTLGHTAPSGMSVHAFMPAQAHHQCAREVATISRRSRCEKDTVSLTLGNMQHKVFNAQAQLHDRMVIPEHSDVS